MPLPIKQIISGARMAELADATDLKSVGLIGRAGSIPALRTISFDWWIFQEEALQMNKYRYVAEFVGERDNRSISITRSVEFCEKDDDSARARAVRILCAYRGLYSLRGLGLKHSELFLIP